MKNFNIIDEYQNLFKDIDSATSEIELRKIQMKGEIIRELIWQKEKNLNHEKTLVEFGNFILKNRFFRLKEFNEELFNSFWFKNVECDKVWDADLKNFNFEKQNLIND